jgi:gamma-glutamyltranspeptidase/glutathione hydrolase
MKSGGIIAAGHPVTVSTGLEILEAGGNAVDAAVGAAFTSMIAEPMLTDAGGGGYMLTSSGRESHVYDFFVRAPGRGLKEKPENLDFREVEIDFRGTTQRFHVGIGAAAVPGNIHGLCTAHAREGSLPLSEVIAPAIRHAKAGIPVTSELAFILEIIGPIFMMDPLLRSVVAPQGRFLEVGDILDYSHVAPLLEEVSRHGAQSFYRGDIAASIAKASQERGGLLTLEDLAQYETRIGTPLKRRVAGRSLLLNGPPATGGALVAFSLQLCEALKNHEHLTPEAQTELLGAAMFTCNEARATHVDPLMGKHYTSDSLDDPALLEKYRDHFLRQIESGQRVGSAQPERKLPGNTTHISVLDSFGNAAAITTSNGEGSGFVVPGCGVHLNNMLGEEDLNPKGFHLYEPGESLPSMMCPMIIDGPGTARTVLGSGGSNRIRTALFQSAYRQIFAGEDLQSSILAPRLHLEDQIFQAESGVSTRGLETLKKGDLAVNQWSTTNLYFGGVHGVSRSEHGVFSAQGDPRRGGRSGVFPENLGSKNGSTP